MAAHTRINPLDALGTKVEKGMSVRDALNEAGAGFQVRKLPLKQVLGNGFSAPGDKSHVVVTDQGAILGMVGRNYTPVSHVDFMTPIAQQLVEAGAKIESVTTRDNGSHCYMRLTQGNEVKIGSQGSKVGDIIGAKLTLCSSLDGDFANKLSASMLRLACENGMTMPIGESEFTIPHETNLWKAMERVQYELPKIKSYFQQFAQAAEILANTRIEGSQVRNIIAKIVDPNKAAKTLKNGNSNAAQRRIDRVASLFEGSQPDGHNIAIRNTAYGLWQAIGDVENHGFDNQVDMDARYNRLLPGGQGVRNIARGFNVIIDELGIRQQIDRIEQAVYN